MLFFPTPNGHTPDYNCNHSYMWLVNSALFASLPIFPVCAKFPTVDHIINKMGKYIYITSFCLSIHQSNLQYSWSSNYSFHS